MLEGLYVITDDILTPKDSILASIKNALDGGARIVQLRDKISTDEQIESLVLDIQNICRSYKADFILNDRVKLAIKLQCDGLHVGKSDYDNIEFIRKNFKGILGVSCYDSIAQAKKMQNMKVDYVAFGSMFNSPTKPNSKTIPLKILTQAKEELSIPICAIGGINNKNIDTVMLHNPDMIAIISDIWKSDNIKNRATFYENYFKKDYK
ncbi:thiamine phosphate synthase [Malaciobacter halophilus]|uniref:Thiamine-phosphate synthase n=1 Tax=Malaciobacter halophilus TaxID=197482 RepID=A0A2N1J4W3_9BACT|nr:thiamine phosphate synthase [Malaciobacter halophilus]AXH09625.1 thiamine phosphate synthase (TMP-TENI domain) [Malaciobacter halophilus]PKI81607.1 thiamine phosphate synthase [Malaciobacter halophilus]